MTRIGFVGVGRMGLPMCANLVAAGHTVTAGDARAELERAVMQCGAQWRATLAEVAAGADILITMLPSSREVREVMAGPDGVLAVMPSTAVWVDMTSSSPAAGRELAAAAQARGIGVLDAPVGGGVPAARAGTLQVFVGGDAAVLDRCHPVLEALADPQRIIRVGGNGAGYTVKLLVNLLWFGQAVATGEALLLARRAGIDLDVLRQTLAASAASTAFIRDDLGALLDGDYLTTFGLDRCCEELTAVAELARELRVPSQLTQVVEHTYQRALRRFGPVDGELLAVALLEEKAGLRLRHGPSLRLAAKVAQIDRVGYAPAHGSARAPETDDAPETGPRSPSSPEWPPTCSTRPAAFTKPAGFWDLATGANLGFYAVARTR